MKILVLWGFCVDNCVDKQKRFVKIGVLTTKSKNMGWKSFLGMDSKQEGSGAGAAKESPVKPEIGDLGEAARASAEAEGKNPEDAAWEAMKEEAVAEQQAEMSADDDQAQAA